MSKQTDFIAKILPFVQKHGKIHDVCISMTLAQAALESGWGSSCIGGYALFGVKGKGLTCTTKEYIDGKWITIRDSFAVYNSFEDSVKGYYAFLENNPRYRKGGVFGEWDYRKACQKIFAAGYATGKDYDKILIQIIEQYKLYEYDKKGASAPSKPSAAQRVYTVKAGDSWCRIAAQLLGKESRAGELATFNGRKITDTIHPGDVLKIMNN